MAPTNKLIETGRALPYFVKVLDDGRTAYYLDHSTINTFTTCEKLFWYRNIKMLRGKGRAGAMSIGSWWSSTLEYFYQRMQEHQNDPLRDGFSPDKGFILSCAAKAWTELDMEGMKLTNTKAYDKFKGQEGAILMAGRYWDTYASQDFSNWKIIAAEQGFGLRGEVIIYEDSEMIVYYTGKPDLVVFSKQDEQLMPLDHKTVDKVTYDIQRKYKPHSQTAGYIYSVGILAESLGIDRPVNRCIINVCSRNEPTDKPRDGKIKPRFTRVFPSYSAEEIAEWKQGIVEKVKRLNYCLLNDEWIWRESSCHLYAGCDFRGVDSLSPASRGIALAADFVQVEPWSPYSVEDEAEDASN